MCGRPGSGCSLQSWQGTRGQEEHCRDKVPQPGFYLFHKPDARHSREQVSWNTVERSKDLQGWQHHRQRMLALQQAQSTSSPCWGRMAQGLGRWQLCDRLDHSKNLTQEIFGKVGEISQIHRKQTKYKAAINQRKTEKCSHSI